MPQFQKLALAVLCIGFALPVVVTGQSTKASASAAMKNDDVISLASIGMSDDVIITKIRTAPTKSFDTSMEGLKALKAAGVSNIVIRVMIDPSVPVAAPASAAPVVPVNDPDDPLSPHSGFFIETTGSDGKVRLVKMLMTTSSGVKGPGLGSMLGSAYSFGIHKMKTKMVIPGTKAEIQTANASPTFWIYPADGMSIQNTELVKLELKKDNRETTGATIGGFGGASIGGAQGAGQGLSPKKVKDGVYKVTVVQPLLPGSYAFIEGTGGSYRDFDVTAAQ